MGFHEGRDVLGHVMLADSWKSGIVWQFSLRPMGKSLSVLHLLVQGYLPEVFFIRPSRLKGRGEISIQLPAQPGSTCLAHPGSTCLFETDYAFRLILVFLSCIRVAGQLLPQRIGIIRPKCSSLTLFIRSTCGTSSPQTKWLR